MNILNTSFNMGTAVVVFAKMQNANRSYDTVG